MPIINGMKECAVCHETVPISEYSNNSRTSDGFSWMCKPCDRQRCRDRYKSKPDEYKQRDRERLKSLPAGVYKIVCKPTGRTYIGQSKHYPKRFTTHRRDLSHRQHFCPALQADYDKYGLDALEFSVIQEYPCDTPSFILQEQESIEILKHVRQDKPLYNSVIPEDTGDMFEDVEFEDGALEKLIAVCKKTNKTPTQLLKERIESEYSNTEDNVL